MVFQITETKKATCIKISFEKDTEFNIYKEVEQLEKRLKKENCFYPWYIFENILLNVHGWVPYFKNRELSQKSIYDFIKNYYKDNQ